MTPQDPFYIGWEDRPALQTQRQLRWLSWIWWGGLALLAIGVAASQQTILPRGVFEWGTVKSFQGVFRSQPYPYLEIVRPHASKPEARDAHSRYLLVKPFKFGLTPSECAPWEGKSVTLRGTLIYQPDQTWVEIIPGSIQSAGPGSPSPPPRAQEPDSSSRKSVSLVGEIVDSKCYFGVMNPGRFLTHRACAIRCISGGIPPAFLVSSGPNASECYLLVSSAGEPLTPKILPWVARPVRLVGTVESIGDIPIFRADLSTLQSAE